MRQDHPLTIQLECTPGCSAKFASLLQRGFFIPATEHNTINDLLFSLPGFTRQYLEEKVQTVFINGSAADSLDQQINPGDTLALSAAMPGLAGAIFRRGGQHGSLRSQPAPSTTKETGGSGFITLKLFNTISIERSDALLAQGILVASQSLNRFLERQKDSLLPYIVQLGIDNNAGTIKQLQEALTSNSERPVHIVIHQQR